MATDTNSKSRERYHKYVSSSAGYSVWQGAHQVAQKLIIKVLPGALARSARKPSSEIASTLTGRAFHSFISVCADSRCSFHLVLQPKTGVCATGTGCCANIA